MSGRIAYVGNWRDTWSTETHVAHAFRELGFDVERVGHDGLDDQTLRHIARSKDFVVYAPGRNRLSTWGLRDCGQPVVAYHLDRFWGLRRECELRTDPMFHAHVVCTPDGDVHPWSDYGVNHVAVRAGVHGPEAYDGEPDPQYDGAVVGFVGTGGRSYHTEWPHRRELLHRLRAWYGNRFVQRPDGGDQKRLHGDSLNRFYASIPIIVGDSCFASGAARYWSDRPYEVWGRGGFLVMPRIYQLADEIGSYPGFTPYAWEQLHELIESFAARPQLREDVRVRIASKVREDCTYRHRALELIEALARYGEAAA